MGDKGDYNTYGKARDVKWVDPTGNYSSTQNALAQFLGQYGSGGTMDANAAMNQFLAQSEGLSNLVSGASSPLQQSLNAIAAREAALGGEAALGAMPGASKSGAGMAAFGAAYADPFAKAQAQLQGQQLDLTGQLWNNALQQNYDAYNNALNQYAAMASQQGSMWSPTYERKKGFWDYATPILGGAAGAATTKLLG